MNAKWLVCLCTILVAGCEQPTGYQAACSDPARLGYSSHQLTDRLYRVRFVSTSRTLPLFADAALLMRSAQLAASANAPAFRVVEGHLSREVLNEKQISATSPRSQPPPASLHGSPPIDAKAAAFRMAGDGRHRIQTLNLSAGLYSDRIVLIELLPDSVAADRSTFETEDVLRKLKTHLSETDEALPEPDCSPP